MTPSFARPQRQFIRGVLAIVVSVTLGWVTFGVGDALVRAGGPGQGDLTSRFARSSRTPKPVAPLPDFDGNGSSDVFWYGPGDAADEMWQWNGTQFDSTPLSVSGTYWQILFDVEGDGDTDIFWYSPGSGPDHLWRSTGSGFVSSTHQVKGSYLPLVVDREGDGADEIFWYAAGSPRDHVWSWDGDGGFASEPRQVIGWYEPLVADLDGDGAEDIFWYAAGSRPDYLWSWDRAGVESRRLPVNGRYEPFTADADGDGDDEIFWYAPGAAKDHRWDLTSDSVSSDPLQIKGVYEPYVGDFDGDGRDEVVLYADGAAPDFLWHIDTGGPGGATVRLPNAGAGLTPRVGDFDGDAAADLLLHRPSDGETVLWWRGGPDGFARTTTRADSTPVEPAPAPTPKPKPTTTTTTTAPTPTTTTTRAPAPTTTTTPPSTAWKYPKPAAGSRIDLTGEAGERVDLTLSTNQDVTIVLPSAPIESLNVSGGRNVTIDGGTVVQQTLRDAAVRFKDFSGELHIRDLHVDPGGRRGIEGDGIRITSRHAGSIATLQRVRVDAVYGTYKNPDGTNGIHGDILQTWGGPSVMRVWKLTGSTNYQGFYLAPVHFDWHPPMGTWSFEDVDLHGLPSGGNDLYVLSGQGDGDFFSADNGNGKLVVANSWADFDNGGNWKPKWSGGSFYEAGVQDGRPAGGEFVRAR
jgi:hypothetical protein